MKHHLTLAALALVAVAGCDMLGAPKPAATGNPVAVATTAPAATGQATRTYMYVMNGLGKSFDEVDLPTLAVTKGLKDAADPSKVLATGLYPNQLVTSGTTTYLVNSGDATIDKLDLRAHTRLATINLEKGTSPFAMALAGTDRAVVVHQDYGSGKNQLTWVNLGTRMIEATASVQKLAWTNDGLAIANGKVYVPLTQGTYDSNYAFTATYGGIAIYDLSSHALLKTLDLAATANPSAMSVDASGKVQIGISTGVVTIDPATDQVLRTVTLGDAVRSIRYAGAKAYGQVTGGLVVFNPSTGEVLRDAAHKIVAQTDMAGTFKIAGNVAYVCRFASDSIQLIDLATEQATGSELAVGDGPQDLAFVTVAQ